MRPQQSKEIAPCAEKRLGSWEWTFTKRAAMGI
jgi:hypothetical protein